MRRSFAFAAVMLTAAQVAAAQPRRLDFTDPAWKLSGEDTKVETYLGQTALRLRSGAAQRPDVRFGDGTIELDVAVTAHRSFVYVQLRIQSEGEREEFYLRPHKSGLPDAMQYAPVFQDESNWQLYHGPGYTAAAELPAATWIHVRIVVSGDRAAVFVGDVDEPQLITPLARGSRPGFIGLRGFISRATPAGLYTGNFANLVVRPGEVPFEFPERQAADQPPAGTITHWRVSPAFVPQDGAVQELPEEILSPDAWTTLAAEPSGLLVLGRHVAKPPEVRRAAVAARVVVHSREAAIRRFNFGYSDEVSVFLNGRLLFSGNNTYSFNFPRRQGLITLEQGALYLPLREGANELLLAVSDSFGGWGLMGQFADPKGLEMIADSDP